MNSLIKIKLPATGFWTLILITAMFVLPVFLQAQTNKQTSLLTNAGSEAAVYAWLKNLNETGVTVVDDSIVMNPESIRLKTDQQYQQLIFPKTYTWESTKLFIQNQDLKKAFWYFMNLYMQNDQNKKLVVQSLLVYDRLFKIDKILVNTFSTYVLFDPEIGTVENGRSKIKAPHMMDKKLNALKEILFYLDKYKPADRKDEH